MLAGAVGASDTPESSAWGAVGDDGALVGAGVGAAVGLGVGEGLRPERELLLEPQAPLLDVSLEPAREGCLDAVEREGLDAEADGCLDAVERPGCAEGCLDAVERVGSVEAVPRLG